MIFWQLFLSYLKIGFFGFGGGYAMLSLIQNEVVVRHGWMTGAEFADIVAVSQITPGPIAINSATYVGYTVGCQYGGSGWGILGSLIATFAVCLPALTLMILSTRFFLHLHRNPWIEGAMRGMRPVVIGLIASAADLPPHGRSRRAELRRPLELAPLRWGLLGFAQEGQSHLADPPLGCSRYRNLRVRGQNLWRYKIRSGESMIRLSASDFYTFTPLLGRAEETGRTRKEFASLAHRGWALGYGG